MIGRKVGVGYAGMSLGVMHRTREDVQPTPEREATCVVNTRQR